MYITQFELTCFMHHLPRTNLLLSDLVKKSILREKEHHLKQHNVQRKGKKYKCLNWNKTWDSLRSTFVGWLLPPRFPTYMCCFLIPRLRRTGQSTLEITCSQSGRGGPSTSPSRQPWTVDVSSWPCALIPSFSLRLSVVYGRDHIPRPTSLDLPFFLRWIL